MNAFSEIKPMELSGSLISDIGEGWMLIAAEKDNKVNMMTASWGGLGVLWNRPVAYIFVRPQRYTLEFLDASEVFSLSFFSEEYREQYNICGSKSGRDINKVEACGFTVLHEGETPYFEQADRAVFCKKLYRQRLAPEYFMDNSMNGEFYPDADHHFMFVGEIIKVLGKQA